MSLKPIHPFPARMAPEIALAEIAGLPRDAIILDPMCGSGTVLRLSAETGRRSIGCDLDPLAVLLSSAWTSGVEPHTVVPAAEAAVRCASTVSLDESDLAWRFDPEMSAFVGYWFAPEQAESLARLGTVLCRERSACGDVLRVCLSRLVITKERGASLARDVSHSRPHKVRDTNRFDVMSEFLRSAAVVASRLSAAPVLQRAEVRLADARALSHLADGSFDAVITSPPYLNAIDYMRGHKFALIWLGHTLSELRQIRASAVGSETGPCANHELAPILDQVKELRWYAKLLPRQAGMVRRYASDIHGLMREIGRVLKDQGRAVLVVGNSCIRGVYVENSQVIQIAASEVGLRCDSAYVRDLPSSLRYLPLSAKSPNNLARRMRKECVLSFAKN